MRLRVEVGLDRLGQGLLVDGVRQEVRTAAKHRTPSDVYAVQSARVNTDLLVQRGGQPLRPEVWRLHHMSVAIDDLVWAVHGCFPPPPSRPSAEAPPRFQASGQPGSPEADCRTAPGSPTGSSA